jgi:hypothetical protein
MVVVIGVKQSGSMSENTRVARPRLVAVDRRQLVMRTIDVELLIEEDHPARSIWELVGRLDLGGKVGRKGQVPFFQVSM